MLVGQVGVELHRFEEPIVVEIEVGGIHPRNRPRYTVIHGEQPGSVERDPRVDEAPLPVPSRPALLGKRLGGIQEFGEAPWPFPATGRRWHAGVVE